MLSLDNYRYLNSLFKILIGLSFLLLNLNAKAQKAITEDDIIAAEKMYDLHFTKEKRDSMVSQLTTYLGYYKYLHTFNMPNSVPMPQWFDPVLPGMQFNTQQQPMHWLIPDNVQLPS